MTRRALAVAFTVLAVWAAGSLPAFAHSIPVASVPADKSTVATGPATASITFNEPIQEKFDSLTVVGPDGNLWSRGTPTVNGPTVSVPVGDLGPVGTYTIAYRVTSADGHPVTGTRTFELTTAGSGTPGPPADADAGADSKSGGIPLWPFLVAAGAVFAAGLFLALRKRA